MRLREPELFVINDTEIFVIENRWLPPGVMASVGNGPFQAPPSIMDSLFRLDDRRRGVPTEAEGWE